MSIHDTTSFYGVRKVGPLVRETSVVGGLLRRNALALLTAVIPDYTLFAFKMLPKQFINGHFWPVALKLNSGPSSDTNSRRGCV